MNRRHYLEIVSALWGAGFVGISLTSCFDIGEGVVARDLWRKRAIIANVADLIIPTTDTPGAKDAGIDLYIITVMLECNNTRQQHRFLRGLEHLEHYAKLTYGMNYLSCTNVDQYNILQYFSEKENSGNNIFSKVGRNIFGKPFFTKIRDLTVEGYCQSILGATQSLAYDYDPISYIPCLTMSPLQKSWATK